MPHIPGHKKKKEEERRVGSAIPIGQEGKVFGKTIVPQREFEELQRRGKTGISERAPLEAEQKVREQEKVAAGPILEEVGAFEEVTPRERDLTPTTPTPDIPIIGPSVGALGEVSLRDESLREASARRDKSLRESIEKQLEDTRIGFPELSDESIREIALRQIREKAFQKELSRSEQFGSFVETIPIGAIPLIGGDVSSFINGLTNDPFSSAEETLSHINKIKEAASTGQEKVRNNLEDPDFGLDRARSMEEDLAELTGKMKLLIAVSAKLRADPEQVNTIQEAILEAEEKVARYRRAASFGWTAQLTGTGRIVPTDEQLFFELREGSK